MSFIAETLMYVRHRCKINQSKVVTLLICQLQRPGTDNLGKNITKTSALYLCGVVCGVGEKLGHHNSPSDGKIHHLLQPPHPPCENKHIKRQTVYYISLLWREKLFRQTFAHEYLVRGVMNMH